MSLKLAAFGSDPFLTYGVCKAQYTDAAATSIEW